MHCTAPWVVCLSVCLVEAGYVLPGRPEDTTNLVKGKNWQATGEGSQDRTYQGKMINRITRLNFQLTNTSQRSCGINATSGLGLCLDLK